MGKTRVFIKNWQRQKIFIIFLREDKDTLYSEAVQGSWPELTTLKHFETDVISTLPQPVTKAVSMVAKWRWWLFSYRTALQKASVPLKSPRSSGWQAFSGKQQFHVITIHDADPLIPLPSTSLYFPLWFFLKLFFSTFVNENHLSKQGQNLSHTLLNPLIGGKKMNYFTFIFTSGKKYGIQVFCAKFWREMIFSHPSNRWLGKWSGLKCKCGDINYCCYWDIYKNSVALF